jgi:hypothetical protein
VDIIKSEEEKEIDRCDKLNKHFLNKRFKPFEYSKNRFNSVCENYFDNVDLVFEKHRCAVKFKLKEYELKQLHKSWMDNYEEYEFKWFKYYWNYHTSDLLVYRDYNYDWDSLSDDSVYYKKINLGIAEIIGKYRTLANK